jgi:hypothetical protein
MFLYRRILFDFLIFDMVPRPVLLNPFPNGNMAHFIIFKKDSALAAFLNDKPRKYKCNP